jgi:hypothetical protein
MRVGLQAAHLGIVLSSQILELGRGVLKNPGTDGTLPITQVSPLG